MTIIWIEAILGAGKTTLAKKLAGFLQSPNSEEPRVLFEPFATNPFFPLFAEDQKKWAIWVQLQFAIMRRRHHRVACAESANGRLVLMDRGLPGDRAFAKLHHRKGNIDDMQFRLYEEFFEDAMTDFRPPSLVVFLDVDPEVAFRRMKQRGRPEEIGIDLAYLGDLRDEYADLIATIEHGRHAWTKGMSILRVPYNVDHQPIEPIVRRIELALQDMRL